MGGITAIEQRVLAGSNFDGTMPAGQHLYRHDIQIWRDPQTAGGLFDFKITEPYIVRSIELKLGGQTSWTVHKTDTHGTELLICCGTDETDFLTTEGESFIISEKQTLIVRTTGATAALLARISIQTIG